VNIKQIAEQARLYYEIEAISANDLAEKLQRKLASLQTNSREHADVTNLLYRLYSATRVRNDGTLDTSLEDFIREELESGNNKDVDND